MKSLTEGSLFAGIMGLGLGFHRSGFRNVWAVEKEPFCQAIIKTHFPDTELYDDVKTCGRHNLSPVDVITAGFPCQDLSVAGKRAGLEGDRSGLFWEAHRIIGELRPTWFVLENVPGLFSSNEGRDFAVLLDALDQLGYGLSWRVCDSRYWNVAQRRERVFIVGHSSGICPGSILLDGACLPGDSAQGGETWENLANTITEGVGRCGSRGCDDGANLSYSLSGQGRLDGPVETFVAHSLRASDGHHGHSSPRGDGCDNLVAGTLGTRSKSRGYSADEAAAGHYIAAPLQSHSKRHGHAMTTQQAAESGHLIAATLDIQQELSYSLNNPGNGGRSQERNVQQGMTVRRLTPVECERLQNFSDGFTIPDHKFWKYKDDPEWPLLPKGLDSARYRALGNAVTVSVAQWIAERIAKQENRKELPCPQLPLE